MFMASMIVSLFIMCRVFILVIVINKLIINIITYLFNYYFL